MEILISSRNPDKIKEIKEILQHLPITLHTALEFDNLPDVVEDRETLLENALKKAKEIVDITGIATISDDTGLFIDALNGEPGVRAARYAGENCSYKDNREKVLKAMQGEKTRDARFITVAVLVLPDGNYTYADGTLEGNIAETETGERGFGYDSIFLPAGRQFTLAETSSEEKNLISHRGIAFRNLAKQIEPLTACR